jgi:hypothetical protein
LEQAGLEQPQQPLSTVAILRSAPLLPQVVVAVAQTAQPSRVLLLLAQMADLVAAVQTAQMLVLATLRLCSPLKEVMAALVATRQTLVEQVVVALLQPDQMALILMAVTAVTARLRLSQAAA